jgi:hypothetical protein
MCSVVVVVVCTVSEFPAEEAGNVGTQLFVIDRYVGERQGATHHGGAGDVGASDDSLDSQEAPRKLHDNNGVLGFLRNAISGPEIGTMVALKTPHDVQKIFLAVWRGKV